MMGTKRNQFQTGATFSRRGLGAALLSAVVLLLVVVYLISNVDRIKSAQFCNCDTDLEAAAVDSAVTTKTTTQRQKGCNCVEDYIEDGNYNDFSKDNPWRQMKWGLPPAKCRVNGHLIERLDPTYNYRRGIGLRFSEDNDDKTHLEPWFLGARVDLNLRKRRVYIDIGANLFNTSVVWFNQRYPCDFTEVHAFEVEPELFQLPVGFVEKKNLITEGTEEARAQQGEPGYLKVKNRDGDLPQWMIDRIHFYNKYISDKDDEESVNITRFIKEELKLTKDDAVVVKMDIEGSEWPIVNRWLKDPEMPKIIDELWMEVHYYHQDNNYTYWKAHSRGDVTKLLAEMRFKGFYVHYWT